MAVITGRNVLTGLKEFRRFLNQERANLCATPILLLDSDLTDSQSSSSSRDHGQAQPSELLQHVQLLCTSVGLRTATSRPSSNHFPFVNDVQDTLEFAKRIGASSTVIGVGGSGSIELAKTIAQENQSLEQLILVPGSFGATLFAGASQSLLLDPEETAMVPRPPNNTPLREDLPCHVVLPDKMIYEQDSGIIKSAVYAGLVLSLDALYRGVGVDQTNEAIVKVDLATKLIDHLKDDSQEMNPEMEADLQNVMLWAGSNMSFGLSANGLNPRSVPLALASSLVPTTFPEYRLLDFVSCLLPGIVSILQDRPEHAEMAMSIYHKLNSTCPRLAQSAADELQMHSLISKINSDGAEWDCLDVDTRVMEKVLNASLDL